MFEFSAHRRAFIAGLLSIMGSKAFAQPRISEAELAIFSTEPATHALARRLVHTGEGRTYQLFTAMPRHPSAGGYPVLYMLDGNAAFNALTVALLASAPQLVLVGVGYDTPCAWM